MSRRILCPVPGYEAVAVILPDTWLGSHLMRRDEASRATSQYKSPLISMAAVSLAISEVSNFPGITGDDPSEWDLTQTPIQLMQWLVETVIPDFNKAFVVPKASSSLSSAGLEATPKTTNTASMAGDLAASQ